MRDDLIVHPRIAARHPEIAEDDVRSAWASAISSAPRLGKSPTEYVVLGFDARGGLLELVAVRLESMRWLVFHAMTPPSDGTLKEMGIRRR